MVPVRPTATLALPAPPGFRANFSTLLADPTSRIAPKPDNACSSANYFRSLIRICVRAVSSERSGDLGVGVHEM